MVKSVLEEEDLLQMAHHISSPVSGPVALTACTAMAVFYVAILYSPTLVLRLPPPVSLQNFLIRRFLCAIVSSILSVFLCALLLPIKSFWETSSIFGVYGIRADHLWQAVLLPLSLTSLMYAGSFASKFLFLMGTWKDDKRDGEARLFKCITPQWLLGWIHSISSNVLAWRTYVVAPLSEELVFRACMIPLLLCGGFKTYNIIFLSPIFFSLAHLNHFLELYYQQNYSFLKVALMLGLQLGYTVIFGSYASFLFIRTGHLLAPIVAHVFCNVMGLPMLSSTQGKGVTTVSFLVGMLCFLWLLFPATSPDLYNDRLDNCRCWHAFCNWK
eukprot:TRINITY_DN2474_c1_g1_i1.p1 TRINITY_DN2474_c1_g1~~TRINITY_DN2474_c1_g1_i1.p1  ORF type:complete len:328 (+),score=33.88 TRINITY_DN2474_c1_g1_i1:169-1152(+)